MCVYTHNQVKTVPIVVWLQEEKLRAELMARASKPSEEQLKWDEEFEEGWCPFIISLSRIDFVYFSL